MSENEMLGHLKKLEAAMDRIRQAVDEAESRKRKVFEVIRRLAASRHDAWEKSQDAGVLMLLLNQVEVMASAELERK